MHTYQYLSAYLRWSAAVSLGCHRLILLCLSNGCLQLISQLLLRRDFLQHIVVRESMRVTWSKQLWNVTDGLQQWLLAAHQPAPAQVRLPAAHSSTCEHKCDLTKQLWSVTAVLQQWLLVAHQTAPAQIRLPAQVRARAAH